MTSKIFNLPKEDYVGDLGRMSYQIDSLHLRQTHVELNVSHFYKKNYHNEEIDVVTLGDSFFNGGGGGKNPYLQDYMVKKSNLKVLNIINFNPQQSPIALIENMIKVGWFKKHKPKYLILESAEKSIPSKFDLEKTFFIQNLEKLEKMILSPGHTLFTYVPKIKIINTANYKSLYYNIAYKFNRHAQKDVYKLKLKNKLFSINNNNHLLVYHEDIDYVKYFSTKKLLQINNRMNTISKKLKKEGVKFIFFAAVDKFDLYREYLIDKNLPTNTFFSDYEKLEKEYQFINTKKILQPLLKQNIQDLFYIDDTHWSYKANDEISTKLLEVLQ